MGAMQFNGVNGATGGYLLPELTAGDLVRVAMGETLDPSHLAELKHKRKQAGLHLGPVEGVDPKHLDQAGWGIIFAANSDQNAAIKDALQPLLELRKAQAEDLYRVFDGPAGYRTGESKSRFLARHRVGPGPPKPQKMPYYLMIAASPEAVPFSFQYQLDVQYAVGRIHFATVEEYARYAAAVVAAEKGQTVRNKTASFFSPRNPDDRATQLSADQLVTPLSAYVDGDQPEWTVVTHLEDGAGKQDLANLLNDRGRPALVFSASHGVGFPNGDERQLGHQGALICQDWPGPLLGAGQPIPEEYYFSGDDLAADADVAGLVSFCFACFGAGTPQLDDFANNAFEERLDIAPHPFIARLPQRFLAHPKGGALAFIGHVERAWSYSFVSGESGDVETAVFEATLKRLLEGHPVGSAMEFFDLRYAELASDLTVLLEEKRHRVPIDDLELARTWTANNDARSYAIVGDPAVRLAV